MKPHISINVRNVERSIDFYRRMLGIEPAKVRSGYAWDLHMALPAWRFSSCISIWLLERKAFWPLVSRPWILILALQ